MEREKVLSFLPPLGGPTDEEVAEAKKTLKKRDEALEAQRKGTLLKCTTQFATGRGCGKLSEVRGLTYTQSHRYISPYGCTGGDYWVPKEGSWLCPECGHRNRLYRSPDIVKMKQSFKCVEDTYDE
ncbi:MAG: hypothetical protein AB1698_01605 [Pseudomonadota bacterium]